MDHLPSLTDIDRAFDAMPEDPGADTVTPLPLEELEFIEPDPAPVQHGAQSGDGHGDEGYVTFHVAPQRAGWTVIAAGSLRIERCCEDRETALEEIERHLDVGAAKLIYLHDGFGKCRRIVVPRCIGQSGAADGGGARFA